MDVAPSAPSALAVAKNGYSSIALSWSDNSSNETGFQIERSLQPSSGFSQIVQAIANAEAYVDNDVTWGQMYYYRIRAINAVGSSEFFGPVSGSAWMCEDTFTDTRSGSSTTYRTVKIDEQCWMQENLRYTTAQSNCYDETSSNCNVYGRMYFRDVISTACPPGWRLPNTTDWTELLSYAETFDTNATGGINALMDESATNFSQATNATGFSGLPGGYYYYGFDEIDEQGMIYYNYQYYGMDWEATWWISYTGSSENWPVLLASGDGPFAAIDNDSQYGCPACQAYVRCLKQ
jgi:uncharacterized protein (TIGR02145 family)